MEYRLMATHTTYRVYAGTESVVHEDDFECYDIALPYHDDYSTHELPDALVDHLADRCVGLQKRNDELELALKDIRLAAIADPSRPVTHFSQLARVQKISIEALNDV
jgi:hypothetical protein